MGRSFGLLCALAAGAALAQAQDDPAQVLRKARERMRGAVRSLPRYTCVETVDRGYFEPHLRSFLPPSCGDILGAKKQGKYDLDLVSTDRLRLDVAVADGREIHSWPGASRFEARRVDEMIENGPIGTGSFGTFLIDIFDNDGARFSYGGERSEGGKTRILFRYRVPKAASHYMIGREGDWVVTAFDGDIEIDRDSSDLMRLTVRTAQLPKETNMCEAATSLEYHRIRLGADEFLLPSESRLHIVHTNALESDSRTTFSFCREYLGESTLRAEVPAEEPAAPLAPPPVGQGVPAAVPVEAGLALDLRLITPIDTDTAAEGDRVSAKVASPATDGKTGRVTIAAGAIVRGRLARVEHRLLPTPHFLIGIRLDSVEQNGIAAPLAAQLDHSGEYEKTNQKGRIISGREVEIPAAAGAHADEGTLEFPASKRRYLVRTGYRMLWRTIEAPTTPAH